MAYGDVYIKGVESITGSSDPTFYYFVTQPSSGVEVVIHNVLHSDSAELQFYDGTNYIPIDVHAGSGGWLGLFLHCTNSKYYRVKNISTSANLISCDGVQTK